MKKRDFLTLTDLSDSELGRLLFHAATYKHRVRHGHRILAGKTVALVFQKPSMRTRVAFEVAVLQMGGAVIYLGQDDIQLGQREPIKDVARALSRYVEAIVVRTFAHADAQEFARYATVPVINGLSDLVHPCQALADLFTLREHVSRVKGMRIAYVGDGNNVLHSLMEGCVMLDIHLTVSTPAAYRPDAALWQAASVRAEARGVHLAWDEDPQRAVSGADVIYTDVWVSMGQEREREERLRVFRPYQVNRELLMRAKRSCWIMHCLPAHRDEEITEDMIEYPRSLIFEQAENRLHVQKALLDVLLKGTR